MGKKSKRIRLSAERARIIAKKDRKRRKRLRIALFVPEMSPACAAYLHFSEALKKRHLNEEPRKILEKIIKNAPPITQYFKFIDEFLCESKKGTANPVLRKMKGMRIQAFPNNQ